MNYTPKTEEELDKEALLPEGSYDFEVVSTSDRPSKSGNEMIALKLCVFGRDGSSHYVYDYIALGTNLGERKLRRAAVSCGLLDIYNSGKLTDRDFLNTAGKVFLKQKEGTVEFPPKNIVTEYFPKFNPVRKNDPRPSKEIIDDDVPF
ncbi:MAG: hypothetical protein ACREBU_02660 [Nitrososphaera sp.]